MAAPDGAHLRNDRPQFPARNFSLGNGLCSWQCAPLAGDASNRRYERLTGSGGETVVLMDAPPDKGEDVRPFIRIAEYLRAQGLSAPEILAKDVEHGFLLLEDLGDDLYARVIEREPALERELYEAATDALVTLHQAPMPELAPYGPRLMAEMAGLALSKYRDGIHGGHDPELQSRFENQFEDILRETVKGDPVLVQRTTTLKTCCGCRTGTVLPA